MRALFTHLRCVSLRQVGIAMFVFALAIFVSFQAVIPSVVLSLISGVALFFPLHFLCMASKDKVLERITKTLELIDFPPKKDINHLEVAELGIIFTVISVGNCSLLHTYFTQSRITQQRYIISTILKYLRHPML
jgi:hypothetical protein